LLSKNMYRILFTLNIPFLGPLQIYTYGVMMVVAFLTAVTCMVKYSRPDDISIYDTINYGIAITFAGVIGSRLLHVLLNIWHYMEDPISILNLRGGGLAWYGGVFGGILITVIFSKIRKIPFWKILDMSAAPVTISLAIGRLGCFFNGCCYGKPTELPWGVVFPGISDGPRHPTQIYESALNFVIFFLLNKIDKKKKFYGETFCYFIGLCAMERFAIEFFRKWASPIPYFAGLTVAQLITLGLIIGSLIVGAILSKNRISHNMETEKKEGRCFDILKRDENILIEKCKEGDFDAFNDLVELYEKKVYNIAYNMLRNHEDAEEILQETFIKVYDNIKNFEGRSKFSTWIYRIATNEALMLIRKRNPVPAISIDEPIDDDYRAKIRRELVDWRENPQDIYLKKEFKEKIDHIILTLPEGYSSVFVLRDIEGLSGEEVSEILGISIAAVKARLHRARLYGREILNNYFRESRG